MTTNQDTEPKELTAEEFAAAMRAANHPWVKNWDEKVDTTEQIMEAKQSAWRCD